MIGGRRKKTRTKRGGTCETEEKHARLCKKKLDALTNKMLESDDKIAAYKKAYDDLNEWANKRVDTIKKECGNSKKSSKESANYKYGKTKNFELRRGDSYGELVDIYLSKIDSVGKGVTNKHLMDDIFKKIEELANKKTNNEGLDNIYDSRNYMSTIVNMKGNYMTEDTYITPEISIKPANPRYKKSCNGKNVLMKWKFENGLNTVDDAYKEDRYQDFQGFDPGLLFERLKHHIMKNSKPKNNNYPKVIIPLVIPLHSMCCILTAHQSDTDKHMHCKLYFADPNGYRNSDISPMQGEFAQITIDCKNALITEAQKQHIVYAGDLLCDLSPQTLALNYIDSDGFCGGFTAFLCFLFLNNPGETVENIGRYIRKREKQWKDNNHHDWAKLTKKLWDGFKFEGKDDATLGFNNPLLELGSSGQYVSKDVSTIKDKKMTLWDDSLKQVGWWVSDGIVSYKGNTIKNVEDFRKSLVELLGDDAPLDWFECHIIMFLVYLDEYNVKFAPLNFYGKKSWKEAQAMLYDNGKPEPGKTISNMGEAGVREYPGARCHIKKGDSKGFVSAVGDKFNLVCEELSPADFEKKEGRKPIVTGHDS